MLELLVYPAVRRYPGKRTPCRASQEFLAASVSAGLASLFAAVCYLLLGAPDVAMTEASIGSGLSTIIFLYAIHKTRNARE